MTPSPLRRVALAGMVAFLVGAAEISESAQDFAEGAAFIVSVPPHTIRVPRADWETMPNQYEWADNFEQLRKDPGHVYPRVVTVYKLPMTADRRLGMRISSDEYVQMFNVLAGTLTVQVRLDKGDYWVLSRESFALPSGPNGEQTLEQFLTRPRPDSELYEQFLFRFQTEIDTTRYLLASTF